MAPKLLVIGVGNGYRGDDAAGIAAVRKIGEKALPSVEVLEENGEGTALMASWKDAERVILIDAVRSSAEPGTIHRFEAHARPIPARFFHYSTHAFGVAEAVELGRVLGQLPSRLILYGIEGKNFEAGTALSPEVQEAVERVTDRILQDLRDA